VLTTLNTASTTLRSEASTLGSNLSIVQVGAKDSQMKPISFVTGEATLRVQP
jgi:hypothetical protein